MEQQVNLVRCRTVHVFQYTCASCSLLFVVSSEPALAQHSRFWCVHKVRDKVSVHEVIGSCRVPGMIGMQQKMLCVPIDNLSFVGKGEGETIIFFGCSTLKAVSTSKKWSKNEG